MDINYDILDFTYDKRKRRFAAQAERLFPSRGNYKTSFPNVRRQFYIRNKRTGHAYRFRFLKETADYLIFGAEGNAYFVKVNIGNYDMPPSQERAILRANKAFREQVKRWKLERYNARVAGDIEAVKKLTAQIKSRCMN